jgi:hypothetical protein
MIFVVTPFFLVTLHIMVEYIVFNTFIYLSEHLHSVKVIVCCNTFLDLVTLLHYGRAQYRTKEPMVCNTYLYLL